MTRPQPQESETVDAGIDAGLRAGAYLGDHMMGTLNMERDAGHSKRRLWEVRTWR